MAQYKKSSQSSPNYKRSSKERNHRNDENDSARHASQHYRGSPTNHITLSSPRAYSSSSRSNSSQRESRSPSVSTSVVGGDRGKYTNQTSPALSPCESNLLIGNLKYGKRRRSASESQSPSDHGAFYNKTKFEDQNSPHHLSQR